MRQVRAVPASRKWVLFACVVAMFALAACTCGGGDEGIHSTACNPKIPALARNFDPELTDWCTAENVDDNCDGDPDKNCQCDNGEMRNCSNEPNAGVGVCVWGTQACGEKTGPGPDDWSKEKNGKWGPCIGAGHPSQEFCDGDDNDCDGATDGEDADLVYLTFTSSVSCWTGTSTAVIHEKSYCKKGIPFCIRGMEFCTQEVHPLPYEDCDVELIDEDCDGEVNEFTQQEFNPVTGERITCGHNNVGECSLGVQICRGGEIQCDDDPDIPGIQPRWPANQESCNGKDDTCDGQTDEGVEPRECGYMACRGTESCVNSDWMNCTAPVPVVEVCFDFIDNDCDGQTDEECSCIPFSIQDCYDDVLNATDPVTGLPAIDPMTGLPWDCGQGIQQCQLDGTWGDCEFFNHIPEQCNLGHDDDCNSATTEEDAEPQVCGTDVGECEAGLLFCLANGTWDTVCRDDPNVSGVQPVWPSFEMCDGLDNNCNNLIDDGVVPRNAVSMLFDIDESGSMCPYIVNLSIALAEYLGDFAASDHVCAIRVVPGRNGGAATMITNGFVDFATCQQIVANLGCNGWGLEWNLDAMIQATAPFSPVPWPPDKYPYVFYIGDEEHQTAQYPTVGAALMTLTSQTTVCLLPGCQPPGCDPALGCMPGPPEMFVIESPIYESTYASILNNTVNVRQRFFDILANDPVIYREYLDMAFQDVCF